MSKRILALLVPMAVALSSGCILVGRIGTPFEMSHLHDVKLGAQDEAQIKQWFGEPYRTERPIEKAHAPASVERYVYQYAQPGRSRVLFVDFNAQGFVSDVVYACQGDCTGEFAVPKTLGTGA